MKALIILAQLVTASPGLYDCRESTDLDGRPTGGIACRQLDDEAVKACASAHRCPPGTAGTLCTPQPENGGRPDPRQHEKRKVECRAKMSAGLKTQFQIQQFLNTCESNHD